MLYVNLTLFSFKQASFQVKIFLIDFLRAVFQGPFCDNPNSFIESMQFIVKGLQGGDQPQQHGISQTLEFFLSVA